MMAVIFVALRTVKGSIRSEARFLGALWKANLLAAMEYRTSFVLQIVGMALNNAVFMLFWVIFFERFENIGGWGLADLVLLYVVVAMAFGVGVTLFGDDLPGFPRRRSEPGVLDGRGVVADIGRLSTPW